MTSRVLFILAVPLLALGCGAKQSRTVRPQPGDTVTPRLYHAGPWKAGTTGTVMTRLFATGEAGESVLRPDEVPDETAVSAEVVFLQGGRELARREVAFVTPPC
jgi:hypothetical protein